MVDLAKNEKIVN